MSGKADPHLMIIAQGTGKLLFGHKSLTRFRNQNCPGPGFYPTVSLAFFKSQL